MNKTQKNVTKTRVVNVFGAFGYLFCALQWLWSALLYFGWLQSLTSFVIKNSGTPIVNEPIVTMPSTSQAAPDQSLTIFAIIVAILMVIVTVCIFIKIPSMIAKTGKKIIHETAEATTPLIIKAQHKKDTKRFHIQLSSRIIIVLKVIIIVIPIVLAYLSSFLAKQGIDFSIAMITSLTLAGLSVIFFGLQYLFAYLLKIKKQNIW